MRRNVSRLQRFAEICLDALVNARPYWRESAPEKLWNDLAPKQERRDFFDLQGRLSQDDFISYSIFRIALAVILYFWFLLLPMSWLFRMLFAIVWEVIWLRVYLWRLHDIGHSGKLILPIVGLLPLIREGISIYLMFTLTIQLVQAGVTDGPEGFFAALDTPMILARISPLLLLVECIVWLGLVLQKGQPGDNAYGEEPITDRASASPSAPSASED